MCQRKKKTEHGVSRLGQSLSASLRSASGMQVPVKLYAMVHTTMTEPIAPVDTVPPELSII